MRKEKPEGYKKHLIDGRWMSAARAAQLAGHSPDTIRKRMRKGLTLEEALAYQPDSGRKYTVPEWADLMGYCVSYLYQRLKRGETIEQIAEGTAYGKIQADKANPGSDPRGGAV